MAGNAGNCTMKKTVTTVLIITVLIVLYRYNHYLRPGIPTSIPLTQSLKPNSRITLRVPRGYCYTLILGFREQQDFNEFPSSGRVRVRDVEGAEVLDRKFEKVDLLDTNWLQGKGSFSRSPVMVADGEILRLDEHLTARRDYYIDFLFSESMPTNVSVWFSYLR